MNESSKNLVLIVVGLVFIFGVVWGLGSYVQQDIGWIGNVETHNDRVGLSMIFVLVCGLYSALVLNYNAFSSFWGAVFHW